MRRGSLSAVTGNLRVAYDRRWRLRVGERQQVLKYVLTFSQVSRMLALGMSAIPSPQIRGSRPGQVFSASAIATTSRAAMARRRISSGSILRGA